MPFRSTSSAASTATAVAAASVALALLLALAPRPGGAPLAATAEARVTVLVGGDSPRHARVLEGLGGRLGDAGVTLEIRRAAADAEALETEARALGSAPGGVLACIGTPSCAALARTHPELPTVASMLPSATAVREHPAATGVHLGQDAATLLAQLRALFPRYRRVGLLWGEAANARALEGAREAARELDLELVAHRVASPRELAPTLKALLPEVDVLWAMTDAEVLSPQTARSLLLVSFRHRVPVIGLSSGWVENGALYAPEHDYEDIGRQSAELALRLLDGTDPRALAPLAPRRLGYTLNLRTAEHMGVDVDGERRDGAWELYR